MTDVAEAATTFNGKSHAAEQWHDSTECLRDKGGRAPLFGTDFHAWQFRWDEISTKPNETSGKPVKRYGTSENLRDKGGRAPFSKAV